jgi:hypothetical protein
MAEIGKGNEMQVDVRSLVADFRREYGSGAAALRALGVTPRRVGAGVMAFDEAPPESAFEWLRKKGVAQDVVDEFRRRCEEGAEDEEEEEAEEGNAGERRSFNNTEVGDKMSEIDEFIREKLHGDDLEIHRNMIGGLLRAAGGGASDMLPTGPGGTGIPRNRMQLEHRQAMDEARALRAAQRRHTQACDVTLGFDSAFGRAVNVRMPHERASPGSKRGLPDVSHVKHGAI